MKPPQSTLPNISVWTSLSLTLLLALAGCSSAPMAPESGVSGDTVQIRPDSRPSAKPVTKKGGGYYKDDGPAEDIPDNLDAISDAQPRWEPLHKPATRPYVVLGRQYTPNINHKPYKARGIASWYGKKFHGQKTSTGETYNMFAMTAAHTTLVLPSYARVTNLRNRKSVVVRVIDRGPFHVGRIIDLSYTAAHKLDIINHGSSEVEVEAILPEDYQNSQTSIVVAPPPAPIAVEQPDKLAELVKRAEGTDQQASLQKGIFLQMGAFANADNAENLKNHLASELEWLVEPLLIQTKGNIHRLQAGPFVSRAAAEQIAERIRQSLGTRPTIVTR